ncbi:MAG: phosphotransferase [Dehalococcoidia bacterium]
MTTTPEPDLEAARRALRAWGIEADRLTALQGGAVNEHWLVEGGEQPLVLRRYRARHAAEATPYEHALLTFLEGRGWPVAAPIAALDGDTIVEVGDRRWSLFPYLPGEPPDPDDTRALLRKGALLALLHTDLQEWDRPGQRPTFSRVDDLDTYVRPDGYPSYGALLEWFETHDPEHASTLERTRQRNAFALEHLEYRAQPAVVTYNECLGNNVLFEGDTVTGLLDFDFAHEDARVADIARSLLVDCGPDLERVRHWMTGYTAHADPPLSTEEADLLPDLIVANAIWNAVVPLSIASRSGDAWMVEAARDQIEELPALEAKKRDLRRLIRAVAGRPEPGHLEES